METIIQILVSIWSALRRYTFQIVSKIYTASRNIGSWFCTRMVDISIHFMFAIIAHLTIEGVRHIAMIIV